MFPDFSKINESLDTLNQKFELIVVLLEMIEKNTRHGEKETPIIPLKTNGECHE